ncbi:histidine--tRNA ligase [Patescibacteria group bacterium]|nr:histidine--tRNA ligase [Patescibacteria group bacterium]MBU2218945.1 histidine--tRNA ligase [Patescibacteria group bacterium]MBU2263655.1 histidine--tRNA ligase [Patescibacteria group bacterium]
MGRKNKSKIILQTPKGMHDILPKEYAFYKAVYDKAEEIANYYGFMPIVTPHLEKTELFSASLGNTSDIVEKQMYTLKTRGGDKLVLRPEGTAPIMRSYIENGMHAWPQPVMFQYSGSFFRHEKPQKGRFREFQQFGLEIIAEEKPVAEAIIIKVLSLILEELNIRPIIVHVNSLGDKECRGLYRKELIAYYRKKINQVCKNCKKRYERNPLRLLDCKEEKCIEIKGGAPQMLDYLCSNCKQHFKEVLEFMDSGDIPYFLNAHLVRGLDYYSRTVFEIFEERPEYQNENNNGSSLALAAGGRYDYLAHALSNKNLPAAGGALGVDRIVQLMMEREITIKAVKTPKIFFIQLGTAAKYKSLKIIEMFRKAHIPIMQSISKDTLKSQLRIASKLNMAYALILGQKEALENSIIVKDMDSGTQDTIAIEKVVEYIKHKTL